MLCIHYIALSTKFWGVWLKQKDRGFNTPLQPSNCRSISNMHSCVYFTNLRFYGMHIIIRRNRYNRTFRRYPMCLVYILKAYYLYWICRPVVRGKVCTMQNATGVSSRIKVTALANQFMYDWTFLWVFKFFVQFM